MSRTRVRGEGPLGISGWGYAAEIQEPFGYARASSTEVCHPIIE